MLESSTKSWSVHTLSPTSINHTAISSEQVADPYACIKWAYQTPLMQPYAPQHLSCIRACWT